MENTAEKISLAAQPIYLLGENALSLYLAAKFEAIGENPVILSAPQNSNPAKTRDITIKEARNLKKQKFSYLPQHYTFQPGKLLIITSSDFKLKSELMLLSKQMLQETPIVVFTALYDLGFVEKLLGKQIIRGFFYGWLGFSDRQLVAYNDIPEILLAKNYNNLENCLQALSLFHRTGLPVKTEENENSAFWNYFSVYAVSAILSAFHNQSIFTIIKNKDNHQQLEALLSEIAQLAAADKVGLDISAKIKEIFNTPINYAYPTQQKNSAATHELNQIYRSLINYSSARQTPIPLLNKLMREIYLRINQF